MLCDRRAPTVLSLNNMVLDPGGTSEDGLCNCAHARSSGLGFLGYYVYRWSISLTCIRQRRLEADHPLYLCLAGNRHLGIFAAQARAAGRMARLPCSMGRHRARIHGVVAQSVSERRDRPWRCADLHQCTNLCVVPLVKREYPLPGRSDAIHRNSRWILLRVHAWSLCSRSSGETLIKLPPAVYGYGFILAVFGTVAPALLLSHGLKRAGCAGPRHRTLAVDEPHLFWSQPPLPWAARRFVPCGVCVAGVAWE